MIEDILRMWRPVRESISFTHDGCTVRLLLDAVTDSARGMPSAHVLRKRGARGVEFRRAFVETRYVR